VARRLSRVRKESGKRQQASDLWRATCSEGSGGAGSVQFIAGAEAQFPVFDKLTANNQAPVAVEIADAFPEDVCEWTQQKCVAEGNLLGSRFRKSSRSIGYADVPELRNGEPHAFGTGLGVTPG
jgi:hypothetical protein